MLSLEIWKNRDHEIYEDGEVQGCKKTGEFAIFSAA